MKKTLDIQAFLCYTNTTMFIREVTHKNRKNNTQYSTYKLVESHRTEHGPRQHIILNLGSDFTLPKEEWKTLANRIEEIIKGQPTLFELFKVDNLNCSKEIESLARRYVKEIIRQQSSPVLVEDSKSSDYVPEYHTVDINSVENEEARTAGAEHVVYHTIKELCLDQKLKELNFSQKDIEVAIGVIGAKLINPSSERATHIWLKQVSGIDELMETDFSQLSQNRVYKVSDNLLKHKEEIEKYLSWKECNLFNLEEKIILYDLTNTFFEGSGRYNGKGRFGHSKEKRYDCPLVTLGLVLDGDGFPKKSKMFEGNVSEPKTLEEMINKLSTARGATYKKLVPTKPTIVMDAGIATDANIKWLKGKKEEYNYLVVSRKRKKDIPKNIEMVVVKKDNEWVVRAGLIKDDENDETVVYCHSTSKEKKEKSINTMFSQRFEEGLKQAQTALGTKSGTKCYEKVVEKIGRLKERFKRIARHYEITITKDTETNKAIAINYHQKEVEAKKGEGVYCLRTNLSGLKAEEIWNIYRMLTGIEDAFCAMKSELGLRPVHHQNESRIEGHLFITTLAYHILHTIRFKLQQKEIHYDWETIRSSLSTHVRISTTMKTKEGKMIHIRKSSRPEPHHKEIYDALNLPSTPGKNIRAIL